MRNSGELERENEALRDRLSRLSEASLRINESLDFETVLQGALDSACSLTGARYGVITLLDESGRIQDFVASGLTPEDHRRFVELPEGLIFFEYLGSIREPLRLRDFHSHTRALGLPEFRPPMAVSPVLTFLAAPILHLGECVGAFYVGEKEVEFTPEDEETLVMFASQAALVIANARQAPGGAACPGRPGDAGEHHARGGVGPRRRSTGEVTLHQPGGQADRQRPVRAGRDGGAAAGGADLPPVRREGDLAGGVPPGPGTDAPGRRYTPRRSCYRPLTGAA